MKTMRKILSAIITPAVGYTCGSLWIFHNDNWKISLGIALLVISLYIYLDDK